MKTTTILTCSLLAAALAPRLAPRLAHADEADDVRKRAVVNLFRDVSGLYTADGSPNRGNNWRRCLEDHDYFLKQQGTDDMSVTLKSDLKTPHIAWKSGEKHTVAELVAVCQQQKTDLEAADQTIQLRAAARQVWDQFHDGRISDPAVRDCLAAYDKIHAASIPDDTSVTVTGGHPGNPIANGPHTVGELHAYCADKGGESKQNVASGKVRDKLLITASSLLQDVRKTETSPGADLKILDGDYKRCTAAIDDAKAAGTPDDFALEVKNNGENYPWKGTLGTMKAEVCERGPAAVAKFKEKYYTPYIKAGFKNDKLSMVEERLGSMFNVPGGAFTMEPQVLKAANVWFEAWDGGTCAAGSVTRLERFEFDGAQKLVKTTSHEYCGDVPKSAYH